MLKKIKRKLAERKLYKRLVRAAEKEKLEIALVERQNTISSARKYLDSCDCELKRIIFYRGRDEGVIYFKNANNKEVSDVDILKVFELRKELLQHFAYLEKYNIRKDFGFLAGEKMPALLFLHSCYRLKRTFAEMERELSRKAEARRKRNQTNPCEGI